MIRVLHVLSALDGGGVESLLLSYYSNIDRKKFRFDFAVFGDEIGRMEQEFTDLGCSIFHLPPKRTGFIESILALDSVIKKNKYDIVHSHQNMCALFAMYLAFKNKIPVRIAHSHYADIPDAQFLEKKNVRWFLRPILKILSTNWFACSQEAGIALWGQNSVDRLTILYNAIDLESFAPNEEERIKERRKYTLEDCFIVGCVARLNHQKNIPFLLDVFKEIRKVKSNAKLVVIGDGEQRDEIKLKIFKELLSEDVLLLGNRRDVSQLIQMFDVFVLPSKFEGLGIVFIEAQAAGLVTVASDKVPDETNVTNLIQYISLSDSAEEWSKRIIGAYESGNQIKYDFLEQIRLAHYDIKIESKRLEFIYGQLVKGK